MDRRERAAKQIVELSYEESHAQLQAALERLEATDLPLAESLALYEMGMKLADRCGKLLEEAELRVRQRQPDGTLRKISGALEQ